MVKIPMSNSPSMSHRRRFSSPTRALWTVLLAGVMGLSLAAPTHVAASTAGSGYHLGKCLENVSAKHSESTRKCQNGSRSGSGYTGRLAELTCVGLADLQLIIDKGKCNEQFGGGSLPPPPKKL